MIHTITKKTEKTILLTPVSRLDRRFFIIFYNLVMKNTLNIILTKGLRPHGFLIKEINLKEDRYVLKRKF